MIRLSTYGVTLLELLLAVAIIATVGIFSTGFSARYYRQSDVISTAEQLVHSFRKAQTYSMTGKYSGSRNDWGVHYGSSKITLFLSDATLGDPYAGRLTAFDEVWNVNSAIAVSGFTQIIFTNATGAPSTTATVTVTGGSVSRTVTVNSQGVISY